MGGEGEGAAWRQVSDLCVCVCGGVLAMGPELIPLGHELALWSLFLIVLSCYIAGRALVLPQVGMPDLLTLQERPYTL